MIAMQVRDIKSCNRKIKAKHIATPHLPYLVVVIDEFVDRMATSGKELEGMLAQTVVRAGAWSHYLALQKQELPYTPAFVVIHKGLLASYLAK